jgi:hypothetical protein
MQLTSHEEFVEHVFYWLTGPTYFYISIYTCQHQFTQELKEERTVAREKLFIELLNNKTVKLKAVCSSRIYCHLSDLLDTLPTEVYLLVRGCHKTCVDCTNQMSCDRHKNNFPETRRLSSFPSPRTRGVNLRCRLQRLRVERRIAYTQQHIGFLLPPSRRWITGLLALARSLALHFIVSC